MPTTRTTLAAALICVGAAALVTLTTADAGDLTPPAGPVQPTMRTLDEVYSAALSGGSSGACGPAVPGEPRGVCELVANGLALSIVHAVDLSVSRPVSGGGPGGALVAGVVHITKDLDANSPLIVQRVATSAPFQSLRLVYRDGSGVAYFEIEFENVRFVESVQALRGMCGGTYGHVENAGFVWTRATFRDFGSGNSHQVDLTNP